MDSAPIDIIIPVYRGFTATRRCLESALACRNLAACELIVVDDASPEPELVAWLDELARAGRITLHRNDENRGFVATVNGAMALHPERDVVLLNNDTEVAGDWLDRLLACAASDPRIATVTPFSNNGSICSYPWPESGSEVAVGPGVAAMDALFAEANAGLCLDLPTGVGFCLYIRRAAWAEVGPFDVERFGAGYGEECDFCRRVAKAGWRNVIAADVFVYHQGSVSFGADRLRRTQIAEQVMVELHPEYPSLVAAFIREDPLQGLRARVDLLRVGRGGEDAQQVFSLRDAQCAALRRMLAESREERERQVSGWREEVRKLDQALQEAQMFVRAREADVAELRGCCDALELQLADLRARHDAVVNSRSWRYSRRLRRFLRLE